MLTDFVVTAPEGRNVYSFVDEKPPSSDRSDICRPDIAPLGLGKYFAYKTINISPPLGAEEAISTTKSVSTRNFHFQRQDAGYESADTVDKLLRAHLVSRLRLPFRLTKGFDPRLNAHSFGFIRSYALLEDGRFGRCRWSLTQSACPCRVRYLGHRAALHWIWQTARRCRQPRNRRDDLQRPASALCGRRKICRCLARLAR